MAVETKQPAGAVADHKEMLISGSEACAEIAERHCNGAEQSGCEHSEAITKSPQNDSSDGEAHHDDGVCE